MRTTLLKPKEKVHEQLVHNLHDLLSKNYDAEKG